MTRKIKILGIQLCPVIGDKKANLEKVAKFVEKNADYQPDLILLPEVFNTGIGNEHFKEQAEPVPEGETTKFLSGIAQKYNANIVGGSFIEKCPDGNLRNTSIAFNRKGGIIAKYQKIHMFNYYGSNENKYVSSGDSIAVVEMDFGKIGLSICYDLRFPELYRALTYAGAELIVCSAAWPYPRLDHWLTLNKARAIENLVYFISINQTGKCDGSRINLGHSMVISPWGEILSSAGEEEGILKAEIDLGLVKSIRKEFPVLDDRNMKAYSEFSCDL